MIIPPAVASGSMRLSRIRTLAFASVFFLFCLPVALAFPEEGEEKSRSDRDQMGIFERFSHRVEQTWRSSTYDLYVPLYTWHNRLMYDQSHIDRYNEHPWGGGIGKSFIDEDGDWHALYIMGFMDSHDRFEPIGGYGFLKNWNLDSKGDWKGGLGFTLSITARHEYDYIPLPLPLPLAGLQYKRLGLQAAYIPGGYNDGNVLFIWLRWQLTE